MFGISFTEIGIILVIALVVVGPQKLPGMLRSLGQWIRKLRRLTTEVRAQTGIDDLLRQEGIDGGLNELRGMIRGDVARPGQRQPHLPVSDPYAEATQVDRYREYPPEGVDSFGVLPDDLVEDDAQPASPAGSASPDTPSDASSATPEASSLPRS